MTLDYPDVEKNSADGDDENTNNNLPTTKKKKSKDASNISATASSSAAADQSSSGLRHRGGASNGGYGIDEIDKAPTIAVDLPSAPRQKKESKKTARFRYNLLVLHMLQASCFILVAVYLKETLVHNLSLESNVKSAFEGFEYTNGQVSSNIKTWSDALDWIENFVQKQIVDQNGRLSPQNYLLAMALYREISPFQKFEGSILEFVNVKKGLLPLTLDDLLKNLGTPDPNCVGFGPAIDSDGGDYSPMPVYYQGTRICTNRSADDATDVAYSLDDVVVSIPFVIAPNSTMGLSLWQISPVMCYDVTSSDSLTECLSLYENVGSGNWSATNGKIMASCDNGIELNGQFSPGLDYLTGRMYFPDIKDSCAVSLQRNNQNRCVKSRLEIRSDMTVSALANRAELNFLDTDTVEVFDPNMGLFSCNSGKQFRSYLEKFDWLGNQTILFVAQLTMANLQYNTAVNAYMQWYLEQTGFMSFTISLNSVSICDVNSAADLIVIIVAVISVVLAAVDLFFLIWSLRRTPFLRSRLPEKLAEASLFSNQPIPSWQGIFLSFLQQAIYWYIANYWLTMILSSYSAPICSLADSGVSMFSDHTVPPSQEAIAKAMSNPVLIDQVEVNKIIEKIKQGAFSRRDLFISSGLFILLLFLRFFSLVPDTSRLSLLPRLIYYSFEDFLHFGVVLVVILLAYGFSGVVMFAPTNPNFTTVPEAIRSLTTIMVSGAINGDSFLNAYPDSMVPAFYYISYGIIAVFLLANVFIAILAGSYVLIKKQFDAEGSVSILHSIQKGVVHRASMLFSRIEHNHDDEEDSRPWIAPGTEMTTLSRSPDLSPEKSEENARVCTCPSQSKRLEMQAISIKERIITRIKSEKTTGTLAIVDGSLGQQVGGALGKTTADIFFSHPPRFSVVSHNEIRIQWGGDKPLPPSLSDSLAGGAVPSAVAIQMKEGEGPWVTIYKCASSSVSYTFRPSSPISLFRVQGIFESGARTAFSPAATLFLPATALSNPSFSPPMLVGTSSIQQKVKSTTLPPADSAPPLPGTRRIHGANDEIVDIGIA